MNIGHCTPSLSNLRLPGRPRAAPAYHGSLPVGDNSVGWYEEQKPTLPVMVPTDLPSKPVASSPNWSTVGSAGELKNIYPCSGSTLDQLNQNPWFLMYFQKVPPGACVPLDEGWDPLVNEDFLILRWPPKWAFLTTCYSGAIRAELCALGESTGHQDNLLWLQDFTVAVTIQILSSVHLSKSWRRKIFKLFSNRLYYLSKNFIWI